MSIKLTDTDETVAPQSVSAATPKTLFSAPKMGGEGRTRPATYNQETCHKRRNIRGRYGDGHNW
ncbi:hypothetical protein JG687_00017761 [Phytophthora cactorum]|uniref:Uncharacterized protein n=1 Tax=Phytophthora cactorum TaxID=29920 RepID=A0A8T1TNH7_9STRA|nr:hypothetical protein JG687_00017761 [Phytophthora cactorum]